MDDAILDDLNDSQRAAVLHGSGPLMVLAGAGSGKTRVVTRRIAQLLRQGVRGGQILALTFTNKAAGEMARRIEQLGGAYVRVATFHSACARFLRQEAELIGFPRDYSIFDVYDRDSLIKLLVEELNVRTEAKPSQIGQQMSRWKNAALRPQDQWGGGSELDAAVRRLWDPYHERLRRMGAMDFDDLLLHFLNLLREQPAVMERYRERFPWLLIDEFQDTNRVQYDLMRRLCPSDGNVCVVGDPDQSIYRFRGAEIRNILDFEADHPGAAVVRLEQNYRSTATILRAAEAVIANNKQRKDKRLRTDNEAGARLQKLRAADAEAEADEVADRIAGLIEGGIAADQVAVFYRAHWLSRSFEQALKARGIAYTIIGGLTFFERREIKDLLAYLRVLHNPLDDVSMERIVNVPPRGLGKVTIGKLREAAFVHGLSLREAVAAPELHGALSTKARTALRQLAEVLAAARAAAPGGAGAALKIVLQGTDYLNHVTTLGDPEDIGREENVRELVSDTVTYDEQQGEGLSGYLERVSLITSADTAGEGPAVQMMTVHAAKGLEFDHVFLAGLEDGVFPSMRSIEEPDGVEEERRLMYVALTRARRTLFLSGARERMMNGRTERTAPSSFLREIPADCVETVTAGWHRYESDSGDDVHESGDDAGGFGEATQVDLEIGMRVRHEMFGDGTVRDLRGSGERARALVRFDDGMERLLILEYAGLRLLSGGSSW